MLFRPNILFDEMRMNTPSRRMPTVPVHKVAWWGWPILALGLGGVAYFFIRQPFFVVVLLAVLGLLVWVQWIYEQRGRRRLAASRRDESICEFARSFERGTDTWVIRAVYEELSRYLSIDGKPISIRREDRCEKDLNIDPEDLDDLARDIAFRARRSMDTCDKNPLYGKVKTVGDIVTFLEYQPRIVEPCVAPNGGPATQPGNSGIREGPPSVS